LSQLTLQSSFDDGKTKKLLSQEEKEQLESEYNSNMLEAETIANILTQNIDDGNTEMLNSYLEAISLQQAQSSFSDLLNKSPYLSTDALEKSVERKDVFTTSQLYNLLIANPDGINSDDFMNMLNESDIEFPQWMIQNIQDSKNLITIRTILETAASYHYSQAQNSARLLLQDALFDTLGLEKVRIMEWLEKEKDFMVDLQRNQHLNSKHEMTLASEVLTDLDSKYNLEKAINLDEHKADYEILQSMLNTSRYDSRKLNQLTGDEVDQLRIIAESDKMGGRYAENILRFFYGYEEPETWISLQPLAKKTLSKPKVEKPNSSLIRLFPNPALNEFRVALNEIDRDNYVIEVYNAQGKLFDRTSFNYMKSINCENWAKGIYLIKVLNSESEVVHTDKIIVQ